MEGLGRDARYALRALRRSPGFTVVALLTLALGIGATTAIYNVVDTILLQPLPFADSDRLVRVIENVPAYAPGRPLFQRGLTYQEFLEWRARTRTLSDTGGVSPSQGLVRTTEGTVRLWGGMTSADVFRLFGARAMLGRTLVPADAANPSVVVLSFDTWRLRFQSDPSIVGRVLEFLSSDGPPRLLTVVGVLPADWELPTGHADFYTPFAFDDVSQRWTSITLLGRLSPGVTLDGAMQEAQALGTAITPPPRDNAPAMTVPRFEVQPLKDRAVRELRPALRVFLAAVAVVLLIVCANVANLLLARGVARQREMAVRFAIGASRGRVARQLLTECLVLATIGGALGAVLGAAGITLVKALASVEAPGIFRLGLGASVLPRANEIGIELKTFATAFAIAGMASLVFGVVPALYLSRTNHFHAMGPRGSGPGRAASRIRAALVIGQLVMATVLLVGAGLLIHSFAKLSDVDRGYNPSNVLAFQLVFPPDYPITRKTDTIEAVLARLRASPTVMAAGFTRAGMHIREQITLGTFVPQGRTLEQMRAHPVSPSLRPVSQGYLTAMGVPVLDGRDLEAADVGTSTPAIVISRTVARQFGAGSQVGRVVDWHIGEGRTVQLRVVGVVEDLRNTAADQEPYPEVFIDYRQLLAFQQRWGESALWQNERAIGLLSFAIRTRGEPASAIPVVGQIVRSVDPNAGIDAIIPMVRLVASSVARQRFYAVLLGVFAVVAGLLAAIGVYGVLAYAVIQRTQEIGIRMALGAQRTQVLALVLRKGAILTTIGVGLGLSGAAAGTRVLQGMLFGITPLDPATFTAVALLFGLVATVASYVPALRATKVDPIVALRGE